MRPDTIRGLVWRLVRSRPRPALAALACVLAVVGALALGVARSRATDEECRLEQEWSAGDLYRWEWLELGRRGRGAWTRGDRHGVEQRRRFRWTRRGSELTITHDGRRRVVRFELHGEPPGCLLRFDPPPFEEAYDEFYGE